MTSSRKKINLLMYLLMTMNSLGSNKIQSKTTSSVKYVVECKLTLWNAVSVNIFSANCALENGKQHSRNALYANRYSSWRLWIGIWRMNYLSWISAVKIANMKLAIKKWLFIKEKIAIALLLNVTNNVELN